MASIKFVHAARSLQLIVPQEEKSRKTGRRKKIRAVDKAEEKQGALPTWDERRGREWGNGSVVSYGGWS
jgi:hypothetical protein